MPISMTRTSSGLLYYSDGTLTGWTAGPDWSSVSIHRFPFAPRGPYSVGAPNSYNRAESAIYILPDGWYIAYNGLIINNTARMGVQRSTDRGLTWVESPMIEYDPEPAPSTGISGGFFLDPVSGIWHANMLFFTSFVPGGNFGPPYINQIYKSSGGWAGPYVKINTINPYPGTWCDHSVAPGVLFYNGTNYNIFASAFTAAEHQVVGIMVGDSLDGTFTLVDPSTPMVDFLVQGPLLPDINFTSMEGGAIAYNAVLNIYIMSILSTVTVPAPVIGYDFSTVMQFSTVPNFPTTNWKHVEWVSPSDCNVVMNQMATFFYGPNLNTLTGPNGEMGCTFTDQKPGTVDGLGHYFGLTPHYTTIEPATALIRYAGSSDTTLRRIWRPIAHTDITVEFYSELTGLNGSGGFLEISYRGDSSGNNEYRAKLTAHGVWSLVKVTGGTSVTLVAGTGTQVWGNYGATHGMIHKLKVQVLGNVHTAFVDGEQHYSYSDSSSPYTSGTACSVWAQGVDCDVINLSYRQSDTITVNGMTPNTSVWLRSFSGYPIMPVSADSSGSGTISYYHFPQYSIDLGGTDYTVGSDSRIWGGDTLQFSGLTTQAPTLPTVFHFM